MKWNSILTFTSKYPFDPSLFGTFWLSMWGDSSAIEEAPTYREVVLGTTTGLDMRNG